MMKRIPGKAGIDAAEWRVVQARAELQDSLSRIPGALRATLTKPKSLALLGGAAGLFGVWLERQDKARQAPPPDTTGATVASAAKSTSIAAVIIAFVIRQAIQNLPMVLHQIRK